MSEVWFYHLTETPLESTLPMLIEKALGAGWRVEVRGTSADRMAWLDDRLWLGDKEAFLPHGLAGGPHDALQPVLLTLAPGNANQAACLMAFDGAEVDPEDVKSYKRACLLFDGNDPLAVEAARGQWRRLTGAGLPAQYWAEEAGRWKMRSKTG